MTPSELKENDEVYEIGGVMFVVNKNLMKKINPVKVDYKVRLTERGFVISFGNEGI